jgi:hypothetical protein
VCYEKYEGFGRQRASGQSQYQRPVVPMSLPMIAPSLEQFPTPTHL